MTRILKSAKVQAAFASLLASVAFVAGNGSLTEQTAVQLSETFMTYVVPALLIAIGYEDGQAKRDVPPKRTNHG